MTKCRRLCVFMCVVGCVNVFALFVIFALFVYESVYTYAIVYVLTRIRNQYKNKQVKSIAFEIDYQDSTAKPQTY